GRRRWPARGGGGLGFSRAWQAEAGRTTVTMVVEGGMNSVHDLADRVHRRWLEENPFAATLYGISGYDDLVPDESEESRLAWRAEVGRFLDEAGVIAPSHFTPPSAAPPARPPHST